MKGIKRGYMGLINEEIIDMEAFSVADVIQKGGTILGTARDVLNLRKRIYSRWRLKSAISTGLTVLS